MIRCDLDLQTADPSHAARLLQSEICFARLGSHTELDALVFKLLNTIHDHLQSRPSDRDGTGLKRGEIFARTFTHSGEWHGISRLFVRPSFERKWTLEETILLRRALIISGKLSFNAI